MGAGVDESYGLLALEEPLPVSPERDHSLRMRENVRDGGRSVEDFGQVRNTAHLSEPIVSSQPRRHRDDVDHVERFARFVDAPMRLRIEVLGSKQPTSEREGFDRLAPESSRFFFGVRGRDEDGGKDGGFGVDVVWRNTDLDDLGFDRFVEAVIDGYVGGAVRLLEKPRDERGAWDERDDFVHGSRS